MELDWKAFLGRHDLTWSSKPVGWGEGAFLGNGIIGAMVYYEEDRNLRHLVRIVLARADVTAAGSGRSFPPRVPIGELHLELKGQIYMPFQMRLSLWDAELEVELSTTAGHARLSLIAHATRPLLLATLETDGGERYAAWRWYAHSEVNPILKLVDGYKPEQYIPEMAIERSRQLGGVNVAIQRFLPDGSGGVATAWAEEVEQDGDDGRRSRLYLSVANGYGAQAERSAATAVEEGRATERGELLKTHREWWHRYYKLSFVSIPDTLLEGFYWIQMYKLACATREDGMIIDNQGLWPTASPWPGVWFNMNVQLSYSSVYAANRLELGQSLVQGISRHKEQLNSNVPEPFRSDSAGLSRGSSYDLISPVDKETGNLLWVCHSLWRYYRYSMDQAMLRELLYPLLMRAVQFHIHLLQAGEDGLLHLPPTISPEYGSFHGLTVADAHYDLSLLRWGCITLLEAAPLVTVAPEQLEKWADVLSGLTPLPENETGFMVGSGQELEFGHRHFSHLMAIYPLRLIDPDLPASRELALRSFRHWLGREGDLRGFTFAGAASIAATLGLGEEAAAHLHALVHMCQPNTMYREAGPVMESPLAGAESIHDMLLQSGDGIRIFPALPLHWEEAVFHQLRAEGGFLVSAARRFGHTAWVRVRSLAGEPCRVKADFAGSIMLEKAVGTVKEAASEDGWFTLALAAGEEVCLYNRDVYERGVRWQSDIHPAEAEPHLCRYFGRFKPWRRYGLPVALQVD